MQTLYLNLSLTATRKGSEWSEEENKKFESALAIYDERTPNRWSKVAALIPGKSVYDVMKQYKELAADVSNIEAGLVPIPGYSFMLQPSFRKRGRSCDQDRKKGVPWTEEEHRRFLMGLEKHGKGDWRNISRNFVISKTPTQVASHAQKYYLRQVSGGKDKRRPSIHDITTASIDLSHNNKSSLDYPLIMQKYSTNVVINDGGALMAFGSSYNSSSSVAYPYDQHSRDRYIWNS